eukprot:13205851-Alexandrium_andersonii.AAC.1
MEGGQLFRSSSVRRRMIRHLGQGIEKWSALNAPQIAAAELAGAGRLALRAYSSAWQQGDEWRWQTGQ